MKGETAGGIALLGAAIIGGYYLYTKNQSMKTVDLGTSGLGSGGNTSLTPSFVTPENVTSPYVETPDSMTIGIEDDGNAKENTGLTEISDAGTYDTSAEKVDGMAFLGELAPLAGLYIFQSASKRVLAKSALAAEGSLLSRIGGGGLKVAGVASKAVPIIGTAWMLKDISDMTGMTADAYGGSVPDYSQTIQSNWNGFLNTIGLKDPKTGENYPTLPKAGQMQAAKTVGGVERVSSNYGSDASYQDLNAIAGTDSGTVWKSTYSSVKTGESASKGQTTNTYQASSGQQVALAGISAADYAAYLANKK